MEVVIKIPDEGYDWIKNGFPDNEDKEFVISAIRSGTVLPKGHGDLIDRDKLSQSIKENLIDTCKVHYESLVEAEGVNCGVESSLDDVNNAPTIIPADKGMCYNCQYKTDSCQEGLHCIRDYEGIK